ncbi:MAG: hypothetical protein V2I53_10045, partial [Paracoccaceae bacterium]|nr:hypothetical protein [Paracoccaceae bacterium]
CIVCAPVSVKGDFGRPRDLRSVWVMMRSCRGDAAVKHFWKIFSNAIDVRMMETQKHIRNRD